MIVLRMIKRNLGDNNISSRRRLIRRERYRVNRCRSQNDRLGHPPKEFRHLMRFVPVMAGAGFDFERDAECNRRQRRLDHQLGDQRLGFRDLVLWHLEQ